MVEDRYQKLVSEAECSWDYIDRLRMALKQAYGELEMACGERNVVTKRMIELEQEVGRLTKERNEYFEHLRGLCFCCGHKNDGFDCHAKCYGHRRGSAWVYAEPKKDDVRERR